MTDPKPPSPAQTMRAILDEAGKDAVEEVMALPPEGVDAALRAAGVEPDEAERRATAAIEAALASVGEAPVPVRSNVRAMTKRAARRPATRWIAWGAAAAAAAGVVTMGVMNEGAIVARFRGTEPIGPDTYPPSSVATATEPTPAERGATVRALALAACKTSKWEACLAGLDEASQLDPAGDTAPEVVEARKAANKGIDEASKGLKPHTKP